MLEKKEILRQNTQDFIRELVDIDTVVIHHLQRLFVEPFKDMITSEQVKVKVLMADPERSYREFENDILDRTNNRYVLPIIGLRKMGVVPLNRFPSWLTGKSAPKNKTFEIDEHGNFVRRSLIKSMHIEVNYDTIFFFSNNYQKNKIIQRFIQERNKFWTDDKGYPLLVKFNNIMDSPQPAQINTERILKSSTSLIVEGFADSNFRDQKIESSGFTKNVEIRMNEKIIRI